MKQAAGILLYRKKGEGIEVFIAHQGGPFFAKKERAWTIPKGEYEEGESAWNAARREFREEIGEEVRGESFELTPFVQRKVKRVRVWAVEGDANPSKVKSNTFTIEWPPRSGRTQEFPEIDRADWFSPEEAKKLVREDQMAVIDELLERLEDKE